MNLNRFVLDDLVTDVSPTREEIKKALDLMEAIVGTPQITCLTHGADCEMRRRSCVIQTVHKAAL